MSATEATDLVEGSPLPEKQPGKRELTPMERAGIMGAYKCGVPIRQIALRLGWSRATVHDTIKKADIRKDHASLARSGRPSKITDRQRREIVRQVRLNPTKTKKAILESLAFPISKDAFNNVLKQNGLEGMTGQKIFYPKEPEKKQRGRKEPEVSTEHEIIDIDGGDHSNGIEESQPLTATPVEHGSGVTNTTTTE